MTVSSGVKVFGVRACGIFHQAPTDPADTLFYPREHCIIGMTPWGGIISRQAWSG